MTAGNDGAPDPSSGIVLSWSAAIGLPAVWFVTSANGLGIIAQGGIVNPAILLNGLPRAVLVAVIVPAGIAAFKFSSLGLMRPVDPTQESTLLGRSPSVALGGLVYSVLTLVASIATLLMFMDG